MALVLAAAFACCLIFGGCSLQTQGADSSEAVGASSPAPATQPPQTGGDYYEGELPQTQLIFTTENESVYGIELRYPQTYTDGAGRLNLAIKGAAEEFAEASAGAGIEGVIDFVIKYNDRGLLSLVFTVFDKSGSAEDICTASFICSEGKRLYISDCFGSCDGSYRFALGDSITQKAESCGLTLISYLPPIDDNRLYYLTAGGLTLVYHKYEICEAEAGMPEVFLGFEELMGYMGGDSPLLRMAYFDGR